MLASRFRIVPEVGLTYFSSINDTVSSMVQEIPAGEGTSYEAFTDALALKMFPNSRYHRRLRNMIAAPRREASIRAAGMRFRSIICRYVRITSRHGLELAVPDAILPDLYREMIPAQIQREVLMQLGYSSDVKALMLKAEQISATIEEQSFPAMPISLQDVNRTVQAMGFKPPNSHNLPKSVPSGYQCYGCGGPHYRRDCPHANARCRIASQSNILPRHVGQKLRETTQVVFGPILPPKQDRLKSESIRTILSKTKSQQQQVF